VVQQSSHLYRDESDAAQRLGELNLVPVSPGRASPTPDDAAADIDQAENAPYPLRIGAIALESPIRRGFGEIVPIASVAAINGLARKHGARLHLDAARLLLAPPSLDVKAYVAPFDTVYVSLYKYLDAPFGAVLAGSKADIAQARDLRHVYGGLIYQGWIPALIAADSLRTFPDRNARAHAAADTILASLNASGKIKIRRTAMALRARRAGIRVAKWKDGTVPFYINETILRRAPADISAILLG
jgi:threonine aldolase